MAFESPTDKPIVEKPLERRAFPALLASAFGLSASQPRSPNDERMGDRGWEAGGREKARGSFEGELAVELKEGIQGTVGQESQSEVKGNFINEKGRPVKF